MVINKEYKWLQWLGALILAFCIAAAAIIGLKWLVNAANGGEPSTMELRRDR